MTLSKIALACLLVFLNFIVSDCKTCVKHIKDEDLTFEQYCVKFNIEVPDDATRVKYERQFYIAKREILEFNARPGNSYRQCINRFAHLQYEEVINTNLGLSLLRYSYPEENSQARTLFGSNCAITPVDWRNKGAITPVKNQGNCGNCFIFSAVATIESLVFINTNKSYALSEQYVMDCLSKYWKIKNNACNGGQPDYTYLFTIARQGLPLESSYPYLGVDTQICPAKALIKKAAIKSYITISTNNENTIVCNLMNAPLSVGVYVNTSFLRYSSGIYNDVASCGPNMILNHALTMVGYDRDPKTNVEYYILKNSWGTGFGEAGYIRMQKGKNLCGIANLVQQPSFSTTQFNIF